jgi:adenylate kinase
MPNILFIGGVHGVGKTTLCEQVASELRLKHFSAGHLIKAYNRSVNAGDKVVADVAGNQSVLLKAISASTRPEDRILLDGHFVLRSSCTELERIPIQTFKDLDITSCIVVVDEPATIIQRIAKRDAVSLSEEMIKEMQEEELRYSMEVTSLLRIPHVVVNASDRLNFQKEVLKWFESAVSF